jgi:hypothetical protein
LSSLLHYFTHAGISIPGDAAFNPGEGNAPNLNAVRPFLFPLSVGGLFSWPFVVQTRSRNFNKRVFFW